MVLFGGGPAAARRLDDSALAQLQRHGLFSFQIRDERLASRVRELRELLRATQGEPDQGELLGELVHEIEEQLLDDPAEMFLLAALQKFAQEMELLLDLDDEDSGSEAVPTKSSWHRSPMPSPAPVEVAVGGTSTVKASALPRNAQTKKEEDELRCGVCGQLDSLESDPIVICEICGVAVHQTCYRIDELPEGDWFCHPCAQYMQFSAGADAATPTHELQCQACYAKGGAFVPADSGGWVHLVCTMFLPELYMVSHEQGQGGASGQVFGGVGKLGARRKLRCCFCKISDKGACGQCSVGNCTIAYHPLCAVRNGIQVRFLDDTNQFGSACLRHQQAFLRSCRDDTDVDMAEVPARPIETPRLRQHKKSGQDGGHTSTDPSSDKKRHRKRPWSDDEGNDDDTYLDSESDPHGSEFDSDLDDSDVEFTGVTRPEVGNTRQTRQSSGPSQDRAPAPEQSKPGNVKDHSKRVKQSTLPFFISQSALSGSGAPAISERPSSATKPRPAVSSSSVSAATSSQNDMESAVFTPVFAPPGFGNADDPAEKDFEYVMVLCWSQPLGIGIISRSTSTGDAIFLRSGTTRNPTVLEALKREVIRDGDEVFAFNDHRLRKRNMLEIVNEILPALELPVRCWFRTRRRSLATVPIPLSSPAPATPADAPAIHANRVKSSSSTLDLALEVPVSSKEALQIDPPSSRPSASSGDKRVNEVDDAILTTDWPWCYLRSDGKLAMNIFWRSLDSGFFLPKINKHKLQSLQNQLEEMIGVRLQSTHPEYDHVRELLVMPRRERIPAYLVEFRKSRKQKQKFLSSDIFLGVHTETASNETEVDESIPIDVGTTVTVAKRTWPGINKLGGAGRIKKVNEEILSDGKKRYTYNVGYVLGGNEKKIERKYISVVDLSKESEEKNDGGDSAAAGGNSGTSAAQEHAEEDTSTAHVRLSFQVAVSGDVEGMHSLPDQSVVNPLPKRFLWQASVVDGNVFGEHKVKESASAGMEALPAKELLLHKHFDKQLKPEDAMVKACFTPQLTDIEDRVGDEVDEDDDEESDQEEEDTITKELESLQTQFQTVMTTNEQIFDELTQRVQSEYATKAYRHRILEQIQWKNYEQMYKDMAAARDAFDDSDEENDSDNDGNQQQSDDDDDAAESEPEDESFGGLFVNKIKQEGNETCVLCELSGGDFAATSCGRVVHPQCAMFTPETFFKDGVAHGVQNIPAERRSLTCAICHGRQGLSKVQCSNKRCSQSYHVACAFINGLLIAEPHYQAWCPKHLKSSGMAELVELPSHLDKSGSQQTTAQSTKSGQSQRRRGRKPKQQTQRANAASSAGKRRRESSTPAEVTTSATDMSSFNTNRKRRRRSSGGAGRSPNGRRGRQASADDDDKSTNTELRCARRLEIEDNSDENASAVESVASNVIAAASDAQWRPDAEVNHVFKVNDIVEVQSREWTGVNKPGGVARVRAVKMTGSTGGEVSYDVSYVLDTRREKLVPALYVRSYTATS